MKLLKWAIGGASAYVIYRYSIGRKAKGEDVFVTPEKAVKKIAGESAPARKRPARKTASPQPEAAEQVVAEEKPRRKRAPRKTTGEQTSGA